MKAITIQGSSPTIYSTTYNKFSGVDFYSDPMMVDKNRSPYAVNLISDSADMPEKRPGWRTLLTMLNEETAKPEKINGLWQMRFYGSDVFVCHAGSSIYLMSQKENGDWGKMRLADAGADDRSTAFFMNEKLYILTGEKYLECSPKTLTDDVIGEYQIFIAKKVSPYVPTVVINRLPTGGGDFLESYNIIGDQWIEEFIGDGKSTKYQLTEAKLPIDRVVRVEVFKDGEWKLEDGYDVDEDKGIVTFTSAPADSTIPNVKITVEKASENKDKIFKSKIAAVYNDAVVFVAGAERGADYRSGYGKPNYFPEDGYDLVGTNETDIMGYCKVGEYLGIIKESNNQDSTVYLRWHEYQTDSDGNEKTIYRKKQGVVGVGAVSRYAIGMLGDEPLFLSNRGVYAVTSNAITFDRTVQNRSEFVDFKLTREPNLQNAVACEWNGYFIVAVNGHCYLLDSRQRTAKSRNSSDFVYECFYWDNVPEYREENPATVTCFLSTGDTLYFGTSDGRICKFKTDVPDLSRYNDDGRPIVAIWSTCADDDGHPQRLKTMVKKGCAVTLKPFYRSSAKIYVRTEKDAIERKAMEKAIQAGNVDIFNWEDIDFDRFTFNSNDAPQDIMIRKKIKKYKRLQFIIQNDAVDEGFGIFQITKAYMVLGLAKR